MSWCWHSHELWLVVLPLCSAVLIGGMYELMLTVPFRWLYSASYLFTADFSHHQWSCAITVFEGLVWKCLLCCGALVSGPSIVATLGFLLRMLLVTLTGFMKMLGWLAAQNSQLVLCQQTHCCWGRQPGIVWEVSIAFAWEVSWWLQISIRCTCCGYSR